MLDGLAAGVVLQTQFPSRHILVACMLEGFTPSRLALFVRLSLAGFRIPEPAHLQGRLLAAGQAVVLVRLFLGGLHVDAALRLPVGQRWVSSSVVRKL